MGLRLGQVVALGLVAVMVAGCAQGLKLRRKKGVEFDGHTFRSRIEKVGDDRQEFSVNVFNASQSLAGAREAGRYEATRYCIENYGTSDATWTVGPDSEDGQLVISDDTLTFRGRCKGW